MLLKDCRFVLTQDAKRKILENVDILIQKNTIREIGKGLRVEKNEKVLDCSSKIVLPGLINAHTHLGMGLLRGVSDDKELHEWLADVVGREGKLTEQELYEGSLAGCKESLRFGTTTVADMYYPLAPTAEAVIDSGIRSWLFISYFNAISPDLDSDKIREFLLSEEHQAHRRITMGLAPHSPYGCTEELIKGIISYSKKKALPKMIHLAETRKEQYDIKREKGKLPGTYLYDMGFLNGSTLLVHSVWLTKEELRMIAKAGAHVVHCPVSNMKLCSGGVMPLKEMQKAGITVALGTDSVASNNNLDLFEEMKVAALLHKQHYWDPTIADAQTVLDMATLNGAKALGMEGKLGILAAGTLADVITLDIPLHLTPLEKARVVSHLVYSANGNDICDVIVDGKLVLREKEFC